MPTLPSLLGYYLLGFNSNNNSTLHLVYWKTFAVWKSSYLQQPSSICYLWCSICWFDSFGHFCTRYGFIIFYVLCKSKHMDVVHIQSRGRDRQHSKQCHENNTTRSIEDDQLCSLPPTIYIVVTSTMILETSTMVYIFIKEYKKLMRNKVSHAEPSRPVRSEVIRNQRLIQRSESFPVFKSEVEENLRRSSLHLDRETAVDISKAKICCFCSWYFYTDFTTKFKQCWCEPN